MGAGNGTREVFVGGFFEKVGFEDYFSLGPLGVFFEEVGCPRVELGFGGGIVAGEGGGFCGDVRCAVEEIIEGKGCESPVDIFF